MQAGSGKRIGTLLLVVTIACTLLGWTGTAQAAPRRAGAVYALTNATSGNAVAIFTRGRDGNLSAAGSVATGGTGTGSGLGSQGALVLSKDGCLLFAVNPGSNDVSVFEVRNDGLKLLDRVASGGVTPTSLTVYDDLVYVLNAGGTGNISGFTVTDDGTLEPLAGSTRPLSSPAASAAQVQFNRDGDQIAVTERATNIISLYRVEEDGLLSGPLAQPSSGQTPFGFQWGPRNRLFVSEAFGGTPNTSAASSYNVDEDAELSVISGSLANGQSASCWLALGKGGRYAYVANTGSGTLTAYRVKRSGELELLNADGIAARTGEASRPADLAVSGNGRYLYVRNGGTGTIAAFRIGRGGGLIRIGETGMLPAGSAGIAVR